MRNYLVIGIGIFIHLVPTAIIIFALVMAIKLLFASIFKKKIRFKFGYLLCEFLWILTVATILRITGIIGGHFGSSSPFDSYISLILFEEGINAATLLNIGLFLPFGFLSALILRKTNNDWWQGILIGFIFSSLIEFLQTFVGRFAQLDDIVMNSLGTFLGYEIGILLLKMIYKYKRNYENNNTIKGSMI